MRGRKRPTCVDVDPLPGLFNESGTFPNDVRLSFEDADHIVGAQHGGRSGPHVSPQNTVSRDKRSSQHVVRMNQAHKRPVELVS